MTSANPNQIKSKSGMTARLSVGSGLPSTCLAMRSVIVLPGMKKAQTVVSSLPWEDRPGITCLVVMQAVTVIDKSGQVTKGVWWMPWHREAMKDVVACDKLREAGKQALIRRFLNEETQPINNGLPAAECISRMERTWGTETSKYPQEKRKTFIP